MNATRISYDQQDIREVKLRPMPFKTSQEDFWAGKFGDDYIERNASAKLVASNIALFSRALQRTQRLRDCIEFGANIGLNLEALKYLYPQLDRYAIEINSTAVATLEKIVPRDNIYQMSILDFDPPRAYDLVLAKTVLIHINPDYLGQVYEKLYRACGHYLLICEYYNPTPVMVPYRGHGDRLFKRDFAGELLAEHPDLRLLDYGFAYRHDPNFPQDDVNWFLLEKAVLGAA